MYIESPILKSHDEDSPVSNRNSYQPTTGDQWIPYTTVWGPQSLRLFEPISGGCGIVATSI